MRLGTSFLIHCLVDGGQPQDEQAVCEIEHVQTGDKLRTAGLSEALAWMEARRSLGAGPTSRGTGGRASVRERSAMPGDGAPSGQSKKSGRQRTGGDPHA